MNSRGASLRGACVALVVGQINAGMLCVATRRLTYFHSSIKTQSCQKWKPERHQAFDLMAILDETQHFHLYNNIIMLFPYRNDKV